MNLDQDERCRLVGASFPCLQQPTRDTGTLLQNFYPEIDILFICADMLFCDVELVISAFKDLEVIPEIW